MMQGNQIVLDIHADTEFERRAEEDSRFSSSDFPEQQIPFPTLRAENMISSRKNPS